MMRVLKTITLLFVGVLSSASLLAQKEEVPKGWHLLDKASTGYYGISADKAYQFVKTKKLKSKPVIVAVIDTGIDTAHQDLRAILWSNAKEIPGNGIDDDKNGYVDDIHGWNFLGNKEGQNVVQDSEEELRIYHRYKQHWDEKDIDPASLSREDAREYAMWKEAKRLLFSSVKESEDELDFLKNSYARCLENDSILRRAMDREIYTGDELADFFPNTDEVRKAKTGLYGVMSINTGLSNTNQEFLAGFHDYINSQNKKVAALIAPPVAYRDRVVKDDYYDINDRYYGNNNVMVNTKSSLHGTLLAGIIAAVRNNGTGMNGIADNVRIMMVRATNDGSEHDKDIALAIRYAVDNGARIINMGFGKYLSPEKQWVDDAVKYAESKNVLIIHAAGNSSLNIDSLRVYPEPLLLDGTRARNWLCVGSSGDPAMGGLVPVFSNYGMKEVNVFAPGIKIYTTAPGSTYQSFQGTSTSGAVAAGVAAYILQYYPNLSAEQLKMVIERSVYKPELKVKRPGTDELVPFNVLSRSGGIINLYEAIKLAATIKGSDKPAR